jgi:hypothetical protein
MPARTSGNQPSRRHGAETTTSRRTTSGWPDRGAQADTAAERVAHEVRRPQVEVPHERGHVVGQGVPGEGPVHVGGVAVPLQLDGHHAPPGRQPVEDVAERLHHAEAAVHEHERGAARPRLRQYMPTPPVAGAYPSSTRRSVVVMLGTTAPGPGSHRLWCGSHRLWWRRSSPVVGWGVERPSGAPAEEVCVQYVENVIELVGHTPLVRLTSVTRDLGPDAPLVLAKVEYLEPRGVR